MNRLHGRLAGAALAAVVVALFTIDVVEAARGGPSGARAMHRGGPAASGSFQRSRARPQASSQRRATGQDVRGDRRDTRQDVRSDRRDTYQDVRNDRREVRKDVRDEAREWRGDRREWYEDRWRRGRFVSARSWRRVGCNTVIYVNGIKYYECGGVRYERVYRGTEVVYIIAN